MKHTTDEQQIKTEQQIKIFAKKFLEHGYSVIPTKDKVPTIEWKEYQQTPMTKEDVDSLFADDCQLAVLCGGKNNLECLDIDDESVYSPLLELLDLENEGKELATRLVKVKTPSGYHLYYRCEAARRGSIKLAAAKDEKVRIETRGEGGYCVTNPSQGYSMIENKFSDIPILTENQVNLIHTVAGTFDESPHREVTAPSKGTGNGKGDVVRPGDEFNAQHSAEGMLLKYEWKKDRATTAGMGWTRPGKGHGVSGVLLSETGKFYCWSTNALPLESMRTYDAFGLYTAYEHGGDFTQAARELAGKSERLPVVISDDDWPAPIMFDDIETPDIPSSLLPDVFSQYAESLANATETPQALAVMSILGVVSAMAAKRFAVSPRSDWIEPVNIYTAIVLSSGNNKTQVLNSVIAPLVEWEREKARSMEADIKRQSSMRETEKKRIESLRSQAAKEDDDTVRAEYMEKIAERELNLTEVDVLPQVFCNDATPEALANNVHEQGGRFAVISDEGGIIETLGGLYSGNNANVDIFLKGIDGGHVRVRRGKRNFNLNPYLTFVLCVQPIVIQNMAAKKTFQGNGSLERFLFVIPKSNLGFRTHDKPSVPEAITQAYKQRIRELLDIPPIENNGEEQPRILTLSPEALKEWEKFRAAIEIQLRPNGRLQPCQGWGGKIPGFALRLAGLLHIAEHGQNNLKISHETMRRGVELADKLTDHALAAFLLMGGSESMADAKDLYQWIMTDGRKSYTKSDIILAMRRRVMRERERLQGAIDILIDRFILTKETHNVGMAKKPTTTYYVNPSLLTAKRGFMG